jgi:hypothetical protein
LAPTDVIALQDFKTLSLFQQWQSMQLHVSLQRDLSLHCLLSPRSLAGAPAVQLASIAGSVVLLPQIVPMLRNNHPRRPLTQAHADPYAWGLPRVRAMLAAFLAAAGATSIPPLEEYTRLPDKVPNNTLCTAFCWPPLQY